MPTAIEFNHVSKQYRLGLVSTKTLSHDIRRFWLTQILHREDPYLKIGEVNDRASKGSSEYVWALRDIDFRVEQGDVVGIIGKNGAGKSTLLKLLSRVTGPTTGTIRAHGRIGSLLEVGTGFHGEMTGRENIYMNGAILGMSRAEIQSKLDEIIDFSGCERYIDTPVKRYSSGMTVRLGFAVAAFLEPEILVVDEVLAVGDAEFQKKAIGKMKDVSQGQGRTVLFVSHNMESVRKLCNHGVLLKNGMIDTMGNIGDVIDRYQKLCVAPATPIWENNGSKKFDGIELHRMTLEFVNGELVDVTSPIVDEDIFVRLEFSVKEVRKDLTIGVMLFDERGKNIYRLLNTDVDSNFNDKLHAGKNVIRVKLPTEYLFSGRYDAIFDASYHNSSWICCPYHETDCVVSFHKNNNNFSTMHRMEAVIAPCEGWDVLK